MKNLLIVFVFIGMVVFTNSETHAQSLQNLELGLRFNLDDNNPFDLAIDGVYNIAKGRRIRGDLGISDGIGVDLLHEWIFRSGSNGRFLIHPGLGASLYVVDSDFFIGLTAEIGLEYQFDIPISLGIDYRPSLFLTPDSELTTNSVGLNVRYRF